MSRFLLLLFYVNLAFAQTQIYFPRVSGKEHERALLPIECQQNIVAHLSLIDL
jgi:hypothetical protein